MRLGRWVLLGAVAQMVVVAILGSGPVGVLSAQPTPAPTMLNLGAPREFRESFKQLDLFVRPVVDGDGRVIATATYGATFENWTGVNPNASGGALKDLSDVLASFSATKTTFLFVVPLAVASVSKARIRLPEDDEDVEFHVLEIDEVNEIAVVAIEVEFSSIGDLPDVVHGQEALAAPLDPTWLMLRRDPTRDDATGYVLARGSLGERLEDGVASATVTARGIGSPVVTMLDDGTVKLAGVVSRVNQGSSTIVNYAEVDRLLYASTSRYLPRTPGMPALGVSVESTGVARLSGEYDGDASGALVRSFEPGSPGEKAGLKVGDVITSVGHYPINCASELIAIVRIAGNDEELDLEVSQEDGSVRHVKVDLRP